MIEVKIADPSRGLQIENAIARALDDARATLPLTAAKVVRLRTKKRLAELGDRLEGRIAVVRVTTPGAHRLPDLVDAIRAARPCGVQLVWDGVDPARADVERHVFDALERARATPGGPPVVLSRSETIEEALTILIAERQRKQTERSRSQWEPR